MKNNFINKIEDDASLVEINDNHKLHYIKPKLVAANMKKMIKGGGGPGNESQGGPYPF